jgi:predicted dehydrogenase
MHRRSFLKTLAAASAGIAGPLAFPSILRGQPGRLPANERINLALIGHGSMGGGLLRSFLEDGRVQVVAVCDVDRERLANGQRTVEQAYAARAASGEYSGCFATGDFREVLARAEVDAVVIATPDHWHSLLVIHAARAGKDIYVEKPLSLTIPEGRAIVRAVQSAGVVCLIGSQQRSSREFIRAVELSRNQLLGEIRRVEVGLPSGAGPKHDTLTVRPVPDHLDYDMWLGPAPAVPYMPQRVHWDFRWIFDYSGGQLTDWIGHHFDIATWALGVSAAGPTSIVNARAEFPSGPIYNTASEYAFEARYATGESIHVSSRFRGGLRIEGSEGWLWVTRGRTEFSDPRLARMAIPSHGVQAGPPGNHQRHFIDCVLSRQTATRVPIEEAHRVASVAHLANLAFRTGRESLRWDPQAERVIDAPDAAALVARPFRSPWQLPA